MGFGPVDAMVVMEELGRGLVLEPLRRGRAGRDQPARAPAARPSAALWLQRIAEGKELVVLAHEERHSRYRLAPRRDDRAEQAGGTLAAQRPQDRRAGRRRRPTPSSSRRASAATSTTPAGIALFLVSRGEPGVAGARLSDAGRRERRRPRPEGAAGIELVAARRRLRRRSSARSTSASPRSAPRRSARWTSWSRSRSST